MKSKVLYIVLASACAATPPPPAASYAAHQQAARRADDAADARQADPERLVAKTECAATSDVPPPQAGAERLEILPPCWTHFGSRDVQRYRREATAHRTAAKGLLDAERKACGGLGETEISHGPFLHRSSMTRVEPYTEHDTLRGARVLFRKVPRLTTSWLARAIACQEARAKFLGYPSNFLRYSPLSVYGVSAKVVADSDGFWIIVRANDPEAAAEVLRRAQALTH